ncbi:sugar transferase [Conchiformibius steedae]|uniref:Sugar transferase n=1 Tax=Conchiformibius steedae TaxID=153493 RepID=A0A3P2A7E3_9NEIS|nr:sugar transferase [Conchiformibius steedae]RRD91301.1 sugar transferase [Conchiformibius steedae]
MSLYRDYMKFILDWIAALILLCVFLPIIFLSWLIASIDTKSNGFFLQSRVGRNGKVFKIVKIKTMYSARGERSSITASITNEISYSGKIFRKYKIDEIPQLINIVLGQMSFVGPRPDVPGYADMLGEQDRCILNLRPGITGPASIKYANEEEILSKVSDKKYYNDNVIWPDKVLINKMYYHECSLSKDIFYIYKTFLK